MYYINIEDFFLVFIFHFQMADHWETAPRHMIRLDIRSLLQDAAIEEVRFAK